MEGNGRQDRKSCQGGQFTRVSRRERKKSAAAADLREEECGNPDLISLARSCSCS
jgi:hypothetical protein